MEVHLFIACFVMFGLHICVLTLLFVNRVKNVRTGVTDPKFFKTYDIEAKVPNFTKQLSRNYINQFESPTLFYAIIAIILSMELAHPHLAVAAYAFAGTRIIHTLIHITANKIYPRIFFFMLSSLILIFMWVRALMLALA